MIAIRNINSGISRIPNLQQVTDVGNTTTNDIKVDDGTGTTSTITSGGIELVDGAGALAALTYAGMIIQDAAGNLNIQTAVLITVSDSGGVITSVYPGAVVAEDGSDSCGFGTGAAGFDSTNAGIDTAPPIATAGGEWLLGPVKNGAVVADALNYVEVSIGGTVRKLIKAV